MGITRNDPAIKRALELLSSGKAGTFAEASRASGVGESTIRGRWRKDHGLDPLPGAGKQHVTRQPLDEPTPTERKLANDLRLAKVGRETARGEVRAAEGRIKDLEVERDELKSLIELQEAVTNTDPPEWLSPERAAKAKGHHGSLVACFSDFHVGEVVDPEEMGGYNAYNVEIAEQRVRRFFTRTIKLARDYLAGVEYDGIVVPCLGDNVSGDIHDEFRDTNGLTTWDSVLELVPWMERGLEMFLDEFGKVHVTSNPGNHGRDSVRPRYKKRAAHNADTAVIKMLAKKFEGVPEITFDIPDGIFGNFQVYNTRFRTEHGDEAKGGGGIQGAMLPIALRTHRIRKQAEAEGNPFDILLMGHWHQLMLFTSKGFAVNGAGKGYDEYARGKGFEPELPQQSLLVVTPEHGIGAQMPIFVSKREEEGW